MLEDVRIDIPVTTGLPECLRDISYLLLPWFSTNTYFQIATMIS